MKVNLLGSSPDDVDNPLVGQGSLSGLFLSSRNVFLVAAVCLMSSAFGAGCGGGSGSGSPGSGSGAQTTVVFGSNRDGDDEILRMDGNGQNVRRVTDNDVSDIDPAVSRDGKRIAFVSNRTGNNEIFVVDASGTKRLTNNSFNDRKPSFSPDAKSVVFTSVRNRIQNLYLVDIETLKERRLTTTNAIDDDPTFTPNGNIVFASNASGDFYQIHELNPLSGEQAAITSGEFDHFQPAVSPNGSKIAFVGEVEGRSRLMFIDRLVKSNLAGRPTNAQVLATAIGNNDPCFSPDGKTVFFSSNRAGNYEIYSINIDGSNLRRLTDDPGKDSSPSVS